MIKRGILFLLILFCASSIQASSVGISPAYFMDHFEPNLEKDYTFMAFNPAPGAKIQVALHGEIAKYANLSKNLVLHEETFTVHLKLPKNLPIPGKNRLYIEVKEYQNGSDNSISGIASIMAPIDILVPYPGYYLESKLKIGNINEKEKNEIEIEIQNLGTKNTTIKPKIEVFKTDENGEIVLTKNFSETEIETKRMTTIKEKLETQELPPGDYFVKVQIEYGENKIQELNSSFRIGHLFIEIVDYNYQFEQGKINPFKISISNKWNTKIPAVYATIVVTEDGKVVRSFKTISVDAQPWENREIVGYFDTTNMTARRYLANIELYYLDSMNQKLVAIYVTKPSENKEHNYLIIAGSTLTAIIILLLFIYLIIRIRKLTKALKERRDEKEKKSKSRK